ncbi:MAG TPA: hypothetical protein PKH77_04950 [Anaerolineae bacterium]|nr:hypothetical protein [Anaerolineae bacterium]
MPKRIVGEGPHVVETPAGVPLLAQVLHRARQMSSRARAPYVTEVCQTCGDVIALTPVTLWSGYVVTLLQRLETAAGEKEHAPNFAQVLGTLEAALQARAASGSWK